jgi:hypothetical protein
MTTNNPVTWLAGWAALWVILTAIADFGAEGFAVGLALTIAGAATILLLVPAMEELTLTWK